jgi:hypothetical protein
MQNFNYATCHRWKLTCVNRGECNVSFNWKFQGHQTGFVYTISAW